jgi:hypothetical protein
MLNKKVDMPAWLPDEIIVRVLEEAEDNVVIPGRRPEAGIYDPVFSLWDGGPLLDFLFQATGTPK